ncbi:hypothetical protein ECZU24_59740 [Escherichia coli]|nr:hypothetical protein ECZU24_59740 [Escherichia coli]
MNGGKSRSEVIQSGDKSRPQSNTRNPFAFSTEAFTAETMQSMLPQNVQGRMAVTGDSHEQSPGLWHKILVRPGKKKHVPADVTGAYDAGRDGKTLLPWA